MFFEEIDNRTPRERVEDTLLRQVIEEDGDRYDYRRKRAEMTRGGKDMTGGTGQDIGCCTGNSRSGGNTENSMPEQGRHTWGLYEYPLGSVYAPLQEWRGLYDLETGFDHGTIFRELDLPFTASGGAKGGCGCRG